MAWRELVVALPVSFPGETLHGSESDRQGWLARGDTVNEWGEDVIPACRFRIDSFEAITDILADKGEIHIDFTRHSKLSPCCCF